MPGSAQSRRGTASVWKSARSTREGKMEGGCLLTRGDTRVVLLFYKSLNRLSRFGGELPLVLVDDVILIVQDKEHGN